VQHDPFTCIATDQTQDHIWTHAQITQLRNQIAAYKQLSSQKGEVDPELLENLVINSDPVAQIENNHRQNMKIYEQKFESNHFLFFHDLWEYVERKLATQDGATLFVHP
jgi:ABC-type Zn2+ transport system substrate-binding protein/surface adhesin